MNGKTEFPACMEMCLVIGNESKGVAEETANLCDSLYKIPIYGRAESLNASVAAGIMMYMAREKNGKSERGVWQKMKEMTESLVAEALAALKSADDMQRLQEIRVRFFRQERQRDRPAEGSGKSRAGNARGNGKTGQYGAVCH